MVLRVKTFGHIFGYWRTHCLEEWTQKRLVKHLEKHQIELHAVRDALRGKSVDVTKTLIIALGLAVLLGNRRKSLLEDLRQGQLRCRDKSIAELEISDITKNIAIEILNSVDAHPGVIPGLFVPPLDPEMG